MVRWIGIVFILGVLFGTVSGAESEKISQAPLTETEQKNYVPLSDVPQEAVKTVVRLNKMQEMLQVSDEDRAAYESLPSYIASIDELLKEPFYDDLESRSIRDISKHYQQWSVYNEQLKSWDSRIAELIALYDARQKELESFSGLWSETHIQATAEQAPDAIMEHIASVIIKIESLRNTVKERYDRLLVAAQMVSTRMLGIQERSDQLKAAQVLLSNRIFYKNALPLPAALLEEPFELYGYLQSAAGVLVEQFGEARIYFETHRDARICWMVTSALLGLFILYFYYLYLRKRLFVLRESVNEKSFFFIARPVSTWLILSALISVICFHDRPASFGWMLMLLLIVPISRIMLTLLSGAMKSAFFGFLALYAIYFLEVHAALFESFSRLLSLIVALGMMTLLWRLKRDFRSAGEAGGFHAVLLSMVTPAILLLATGIAANLYGATLLGERIVHGIVHLVMMVVVFYSLTVILSGYVVLLLRRRISTASNLIERYARNMERNVVFMIRMVMMLWWLWSVIIVLGIKEQTLSLKESLLTLSWMVGSITVSVASLVDFVMIIIATWVIVKAVNIFLTVEVFARIKFPRGVPTAIQTTTNYLLVIAGTLMAFSSLGITTDQFALIFGALGVGIGFGLRNIIANFISGIIMVFERPVQIGDTIEIDTTMGTVQSIGTRSSAIKTFDGSEVIIPNADFIAKKVTNWTLSDERRRKTLEFKVDFESDIEKVLEIMKEVSTAHADVLDDPAPVAAFEGFGEYYLKFKLYFWLTQNLVVAQSDVAIGIYKRLRAEGIRMPLPRQEILRSSSGKGASEDEEP